MANLLAVLIVEDSESDAQLLVRLLKNAGYEVITERVETADEMRVALEKRIWDIVLSDYSLPQFSGRAALELLKEKQQDIPFIVISGTIGEETAVAMMKAGAHDYLRKGDLAYLVPAIKRELEQAQDRRERKRAEQALLESEERWRRAVADSPIPIMIHNEDDKVLQLSEGWTNFSGYTIEDIPTLADWTERAYGERTGSKKEYIDQLFSIDETVNNGEWIVTAKDGSKRIWDFQTTPLGKIHNGRRVLHSMAIDITERRHAETELKENQANLSALIENMEDRIWAVDTEYRLIVGNAQFTSGIVEDLKRKISLGQSVLLDNIPQDARDEWRGYYDRALRGESFSIELATRFSKKPGYRDYRFHPIQSADGIITGVVVSGRDISGRKQIEDALLFLVKSGYSDGDFFQSLARYLAENLGMDYVCIDRLAGDHLSAQTVAIYFDGRFEDNVSYTLKDTPCGDVVGNTICVFPERVRHLFPNDAILQEMAAESYMGTTLWDAQGQPIGLIAVIGRKPLENQPVAEDVLKLVAVRAAGELERQQAEEALRESESFTQSILKNSPIGISVRSRTGQLLSANEAWKKIWAIPESDFQEDLARARQALNFDKRDDYLKSHTDDLRRVYEQGGHLHLPELKTAHPRPGAAEWVSQHFYAIQDAQGQVARVVILTEDITERKQAEDQLRQLSRAVEHSPASIMITDREGKIEYINPKFTEVNGYILDEVRGKTPRILKSGRTPPEEYDRLWRTILSGKEWRGEILNRKKNGELYWEYASISAITDSMGSITHFVAVNEDITARKKADEEIRLLNIELEQQAVTDYLTNLYNRRYFMQRGAEEFKRATRNKQPLSLLMLDIDEFKNVNDTYGHEAGDFALQQASAVLKSSLRETDILGRLGGEEFAVLLPNTSIEEAVLLAERVRQTTAETLFETTGDALSIHITVCIGVAAFTSGMSGIDDLLRNADAALYHAKQNGRNRVMKYQEDSNKASDVLSSLDGE